MKAAVAEGLSGSSDVHDVEVPDPESFDGAVVVDVCAAGVCYPPD